jgi:hypothetical protein
MTDPRLTQRDDSAARTNRAEKDRPNTENRDVADPLRLQERLAMLSDVDTVLPKPPVISGYHTIWLTTTNQQDPLERRFQLGYTLVHPDEVTGFSFSSQKSGQVATDRIMINEMVLAKLPMELFVAYMKHSHHDLPLKQEEAIRPENVIASMRDGRGAPIGIVEGDGFQELKRRPRAPNFAEIA